MQFTFAWGYCDTAGVVTTEDLAMAFGINEVEYVTWVIFITGVVTNMRMLIITVTSDEGYDVSLHRYSTISKGISRLT